ncbi:flagellar hook-associated protein FlgL [Shewanella sp. 4_MG-2023]|uniref:flagellar hook-associated protein FlgL n=1 Tax=Shewanella sp. 4_MG-2023 TaxID=3062652 RepID=UPI0026E12F16|nr:flagellar hook-associated protein FlgL [Shewanella sp. 4_MG-2023]MDO6679634.1 flagellar hook-associated protein FlgL [Shewanella sp. 4_MG-2023]
MRVSMMNMYSNNLQSMQHLTSDVAKVNQQMATGKSILRPSDDPIGAAKVVTTQRDLASTSQYLKNTESLSTSLDRSETYLSSMTNLQSRMREITIGANNGSLSPEDRAAYAAELEELLESFVDVTNAKDDGGNYLFSGNKTDTPPIGVDANGDYFYQGDDSQREVQISGSSWMAGNVTAADFMFSTGGTDILNQTKQFIDVLNDPSLAPGDPAFGDAADDMMQALDDSLAGVSGAITDIGGKQNAIALMQTSHNERILFNEEVIGETEGLDYAQATAEFNLKLTTLQVTQQSFVQVSQLSLFNHI